VTCVSSPLCLTLTLCHPPPPYYAPIHATRTRVVYVVHGGCYDVQAASAHFIKVEQTGGLPTRCPNPHPLTLTSIHLHTLTHTYTQVSAREHSLCDRHVPHHRALCAESPARYYLYDPSLFVSLRHNVLTTTATTTTTHAAAARLRPTARGHSTAHTARRLTHAHPLQGTPL